MQRWRMFCCQKRVPKPILLLLLLGCFSLSHAQTPDSAAKRPSFLQRQLILLEQHRRRLEDGQWDAMERAEYRRMHLTEWPDRVFGDSGRARRWSLSLNPLGLVEPQLAAGLGIGYQVTDRWQLWLESSLLTQGPYDIKPQCVSGFREILAVKWYVDRRRFFFIGAEARWKQVRYHD